MATMADKTEERSAPEQLDIEIIPGTEVMKDFGNIHFAHAGGADTGSVYAETCETTMSVLADILIASFRNLRITPTIH